MRKLIFVSCLILLGACAKIPLQTITLTDAIIEEGKRMHELNISLLNKMFDEKREKIDSFIKNEYTPKYLADFKEAVPVGTNYEEEFSGMMEAIIPEINSYRDQMQSALESQRIKLVTKLTTDFKAFENASNELKLLIESAVKVSEERQKAFEKVKNLTQNKIDINQIENEIDKFIVKAGDVGSNINEFNSVINSLLK